MAFLILLVGGTEMKSRADELSWAGYETFVVSGERELSRRMRHNSPSCILIDPSESNVPTERVRSSISVLSPDTQLLIVTEGQSHSADLLPGEWAIERHATGEAMLHTVAKACILYELAFENRSLRSARHAVAISGSLVGTSTAIQQILEKAEMVAGIDTTLLITGESGTGKTTLASYLHDRSTRKNQPFISLSCASIPRDLLESELFGHERGAFTSAMTARAGAVELADGGTLFLDEIGDMPIEIQPKLLSFLQEKTFRRLGGNRTIPADVRIIAATNRDLPQMIARREFRQDLYFRLNVIALEMPPLRDRPEDIPVIAVALLDRIASRRKVAPWKLPRESLETLSHHHWPGNVRELENVLERATAFAKGSSLTPIDLDVKKLSSTLSSSVAPLSLGGLPLALLEQRAIEETIKLCDGDKEKAAMMLGISTKTIYNKLKRYSRN